jgi:hypothetical protein
MFNFLRLSAISLLLTCSFAHAQNIVIKSFYYTDIPKDRMQIMIENLHQIFGKNIELKFHKNMKYEINSGPSADAYVDPYTTKDLRLVMTVPWEAHEPEVLATLCHELGHLVSKGRHLNWIRFKNTIATEGQADYFVPSCMKLYMDKFVYSPLAHIDHDVTNICLNNYHQEFSDNECMVILQSFKDIFAEYNDEISYDKTYGKKAFLTQRDHPDDQCRLDTVKDSLLGKGRNRCWYSPFFPASPKWRDLQFWRKNRHLPNL